MQSQTAVTQQCLNESPDQSDSPCREEVGSSFVLPTPSMANPGPFLPLAPLALSLLHCHSFHFRHVSYFIAVQKRKKERTKACHCMFECILLYRICPVLGQLRTFYSNKNKPLFFPIMISTFLIHTNFFCSVVEIIFDFGKHRCAEWSHNTVVEAPCF